MPKTESEREFFELLQKFKRVIFDWGQDNLWVLEDYNDEINSKKFCMDADDFISRAKVAAISSADVVVIFYYNKIDIDMRNTGDTFSSKEDKERYMASYLKSAKEEREKNLRDKEYRLNFLS